MDDGMVLTLNTGRDDAIRLLREWADTRALIRLDFQFVRFACAFRARVIVLLPDHATLLSDDSFNELSLPLGQADLEFGVGDFVNESPDDAATYGRCLAIFIPVSADPEHPETINLIEVKEDAEH